MAGMDGNRTHPGRLSSAPQTVLKTAGLISIAVHSRPHQFSRDRQESLIVRHCPPQSTGFAVFLARSLPGKEASRSLSLHPLPAPSVAENAMIPPSLSG